MLRFSISILIALQNRQGFQDHDSEYLHRRIIHESALRLIPYITSLPGLLFALFFAMFTTGAFIVPAIGYATLIFSTRQTGLIAELGAGSFSAGTAVVLPICGRMFDQHAYAKRFFSSRRCRLPAICSGVGLIASH